MTALLLLARTWLLESSNGSPVLRSNTTRAERTRGDHVVPDADARWYVRSKAIPGINKRFQATDLDDIRAHAVDLLGNQIIFAERFDRFLLFDQNRYSQLVSHAFIEVAEADGDANYATPPQEVRLREPLRFQQLAEQVH